MQPLVEPWSTVRESGAVGARVPWIDVYDERQARISRALFQAAGHDVECCTACGRPKGDDGPRWYSDGADELVLSVGDDGARRPGPV